jgi:hypothetical protein
MFWATQDSLPLFGIPNGQIFCDGSGTDNANSPILGPEGIDRMWAGFDNDTRHLLIADDAQTASYGEAEIGPMLASTTQQIVVPITPVQQDANYHPTANIDGTLAAARMTTIIVGKTTTTITVSVLVGAGAPLADGAIVLVAAQR